MKKNSPPINFSKIANFSTVLNTNCYFVFMLYYLVIVLGFDIFHLKYKKHYKH